MIKTISSALAAFAAVTFVGLSGQASAQNCSTCSPTASNFGFPAAPAVSGCGHAGCGGGHGHGQFRANVNDFKQQVAYKSAINERIAARNDAWPLPFACWDKQGYYNTWTPMLQAGSETQAVLDGNFFTNANELNRVGIDRVAGIVQNNPTGERTVYVTRSGDDFVNRARMDAIRQTISTYYAASGPANVQLSDRLPQTVNATNIQNYLQLRNSQLPPAILPVATGGSVKKAVKQ